MANDLPAPTIPEHHANAGDLLKQGRQRQRLSISDCAKRTHISAHFLDSLEANRWHELPSESHRIGFLRLYSRFLGVPVEEVMAFYRRDISQTAPPAPSKDSKSSHVDKSSGWFTGSWQQVMGLLVVLLVLAWVVYHQIGRLMPEESVLPIVRERPRQTRLVPPNQAVATQRVRITASADSWMRVVSNGQLLYEGILPAGATKQWARPGEFQIKLGNVQAIELYWNDQPVDVQLGAKAGIREIQLPLTQ